MTKNIRLTIGIIAAIILPACIFPATSLPAIDDQAATSVSVLPTQPETPTVIPTTTNILLNDDFSMESAELENFSNESGSVETKDGAYVVRTTGELWKWGRTESDFGDTIIEFDTVIAIGPTNNNAGVGVICRLQTRGDNSVDGYLFAISGDGFYSIHNIASSSMDPLVHWTYSDTINQGSLENKIRATCNGSELKLEVNGKILATASIEVNGSQPGGLAFAAVSFDNAEPVIEAHFDNLVVTKP